MPLAPLTHYLWKACLDTGSQLVLLFGPGLVLAVAMQHLSGFIARSTCRLLGRTAFLLLFGWLGTVVHEGGHALFCLLFGHRITAIKWFDLRGSDSSLGYVRHSYNQRSLYQRSGQFFIGIGPILLGTAVISTAARYLLGADVFALLGKPLPLQPLHGLAMALLTDGLNMAATIVTPQHLRNWQGYLFLYLSFAVGSGISLSPQDISGALSGFVVLAGLLLLVNIVTGCPGGIPAGFPDTLIRLCGFLDLIMVFSLLMNALVATTLLLTLAVIRR